MSYFMLSDTSSTRASTDFEKDLNTKDIVVDILKLHVKKSLKEQ